MFDREYQEDLDELGHKMDESKMFFILNQITGALHYFQAAAPKSSLPAARKVFKERVKSMIDEIIVK